MRTARSRRLTATKKRQSGLRPGFESVDIVCILPEVDNTSIGNDEGGGDGRLRWMVKWSVSVGAAVDKGREIATLTLADEDGKPALPSKVVTISASRQGNLLDLCRESGTFLPAERAPQGCTGGGERLGQDPPIVLGHLSCCMHPELHGNLCTVCGRKVDLPAESKSYGEGK
ncbi:unnamed protein product, partial [Discosporangium mesarthrocarpum]